MMSPSKIMVSGSSASSPVDMSDFVTNENGKEARVASSSTHCDPILACANDEAGKKGDAASASADPVHMSDSVKNEDVTGNGEVIRAAMTREVGNSAGSEFTHAKPEDAFDDHDAVEEEGQDEWPFEVPMAGAGWQSFYASAVKFSPDIIALSTKMPRLTLEEVRVLNKESGIFREPIQELDIPIHDIENFVLSFFGQLDPLMIWQLVRRSDNGITTSVLHPLLHEQFMPEMRKNRIIPTYALKKLKFAVLEVLVLMLQNADHLNGMSAGLSGHSRFGFGITYKLVQPMINIISKCRIENNRRLFALAADLNRKRRNDNASPTRNEEDALHLNPKRKAEVFMNGVLERKKSGTIFESCVFDDRKLVRCLDVHFEQLIELRRGDRQKVVQLFEENPNMSAKDLLDILDDCLDVHQSGVYSKGFSETLFHAHRGVCISFLCNHLSQIRDDLENDEWLNAKFNPYWSY